MSKNINQSLKRLRELAKAHDRLSRGATDIKSAEATTDKILIEFLQKLDSADISEALAKLMPQAHNQLRENPDAIKTEIRDRREELISVETKLMKPIGARKRDIENLLILYGQSQKEQKGLIEDVESLKKTVNDLHNSTKKELSKVRNFCRKEKKKNKKKLRVGIGIAILGTGTIIADILFPQMFTISAGIGLNAIHKAVVDIIEASAD